MGIEYDSAGVGEGHRGKEDHNRGGGGLMKENKLSKAHLLVFMLMV